MPGGEDASPGHAGELAARSSVSSAAHRLICSLPCLNTDANDQARLTGRYWLDLEPGSQRCVNS
eukprot:4986607-Prymnesium_polylepis.1